MAFNPFHSFRKYRKTMFAIITIICMFVFVLSSGLGGKGDLLNTGLSLGGGRPAVVEIGGHQFDGAEIQNLRNQRLAANQCMRSIFLLAWSNTEKAVEARAKDLGPANAPIVQRLLADSRQSFGSPNLYSYAVQQLSPVISRLEADKNTFDSELLRRWLRGIARIPEALGQQLYFGGSVKSNRDLLNFLVWRWVADQNKIHLTREVVQEMLRHEALDEDVSDISRDVLAEMRRNERTAFSADALIDFLTDEFRVRLAKQVVLGTTEEDLAQREYQFYQTGLPNPPADMPAYVTPAEFYNYYRDVMTTVNVGLVTTNAENYIALVTDKPTDADLHALFNKYRRDEASPELERPGFKEGKKVKVEWLEVKADNPLIRKVALADADKKSQQAELVKKTLFMPPLPGFGGVNAWLGQYAIAEDPNLIEKRIDSQYETRLRQRQLDAPSWLYSAVSLFTVHEQSVYRPQVIANAIAGAMSANATGAGFTSFGVTACSQAIVEEMRERIRWGMLAFSLGGNQPAAAYGITEMTLPPPLSRATVYPELRESVVSGVVKAFMGEEFRHFNEEVEKLAKDVKKPEGKAALTKFIADFAKKYALTLGKSEDFRDRYSLVNDSGLKLLKEDYVQNQQKLASTYPAYFPNPDLRGEHFGSMLFDQSRASSTQNESLYQPKWLSGEPSNEIRESTDKYYLFWKTDEEPAKERTFEAAKADVEKAWKLNKARDLAQKAAEDLQKQIQEKSIRELPALRDFALAQKRDLVEIGPISKLTEAPAMSPQQPTVYRLPSIPQDKVTYPTPDFAQKIVDLHDKPIGQTVMLHDEPRKIFYVGVLTQRNEPSEFLFRLIYSRSGPSRFGMGGDSLMNRLEFERDLRFFRDSMEQLQRDSRFKIINEDFFKEANSNSGGE